MQLRFPSELNAAGTTGQFDPNLMIWSFVRAILRDLWEIWHHETQSRQLVLPREDGGQSKGPHLAPVFGTLLELSASQFPCISTGQIAFIANGCVRNRSSGVRPRNNYSTEKTVRICCSVALLFYRFHVQFAPAARNIFKRSIIGWFRVSANPLTIREYENDFDLPKA